MAEKEGAFCGGCMGEAKEKNAGRMDPRKKAEKETEGRKEQTGENAEKESHGKELLERNEKFGENTETESCEKEPLERKEQSVTYQDGNGAIWCTSCGRRLPAGSVYCEFCGELVEEELSENRETDKRKMGESGPVVPFHETENRGEEEGTLSQSAAESAASEERKRPLARLLGMKVIRGAGRAAHAPAGKRKIAAAAAVIAACGAVLLIIAPRPAKTIPEGFTGYVKDNSLFFADKNGGSVELTDYYLDNWREREKARLPQDASCAPIRSEDGETIWYPEKIGAGSFTLMRYNNRKKQRLDSGVVSFTAAGKTAVYEKNNEGLYWYKEDGKEKLSAGVSGYFLSRDGRQVLWLEENTDGTLDLYTAPPEGKTGGGEEKIRLERNISRILDVSETLYDVLYQKEGDIWLLRGLEEKIRLVRDAKEVFLPDTKTGSLFFTRQEEGEENLYSLGTGEEERLLDRAFQFLIHGEDGVLTYKTAQDGEEELRLASEDGSSVLECSKEAAGSLRVFGGYAWYTDAGEPGEIPSLNRLSLSPEDFGDVETEAEEAELCCGFLEGEPLYLKNVNGNTGDLYLGAERIAYDVRIDSVTQKDGDGGAFCIGDYDAQAQSGSLLSISEYGAELIEENVSGYGAAPEGVYYFTDYEPQSGRGVLNFYRDGGLEEIETDVWGLYVPGCGAGGLMRQTDVREGETWQRIQSEK